MIEGKPDCWICRFSIAADAETALDAPRERKALDTYAQCS